MQKSGCIPDVPWKKRKHGGHSFRNGSSTSNAPRDQHSFVPSATSEILEWGWWLHVPQSGLNVPGFWGWLCKTTRHTVHHHMRYKFPYTPHKNLYFVDSISSNTQKSVYAYKFNLILLSCKCNPIRCCKKSLVDHVTLCYQHLLLICLTALCKKQGSVIQVLPF